jgi:hypothetical protein
VSAQGGSQASELKNGNYECFIANAFVTQVREGGSDGSNGSGGEPGDVAELKAEVAGTRRQLQALPEVQERACVGHPPGGLKP